MPPIWSKWAWEMKMSVTCSARTPSSPSSRTGEIHQGMSNLVAISAPPPLFMKPLSISTLRSPLRARTKEKGTSITPSSKAPWIRLATG